MIPLAILAALLACDVALTAYCLRHGGQEVNPLYRTALRRLPWPFALAIYALVWTVLAGVAHRLCDDAPVVLCAVAGIAVLANAHAARRVRR